MNCLLWFMGGLNAALVALGALHAAGIFVQALSPVISLAPLRWPIEFVGFDVERPGDSDDAPSRRLGYVVVFVVATIMALALFGGFNVDCVR